MVAAKAVEKDAELEEADEIAEIKRRAAAEVEAEKEKAKVCCVLLFATRCIASPSNHNFWLNPGEGCTAAAVDSRMPNWYNPSSGVEVKEC